MQPQQVSLSAPVRHPFGLAGLLLLLMFFLMLGSGLHKNLSYDEPNNLRYAYKLLSEGPMADPEGQRMPVLALNAIPCRSYQCDWKILEGSETARIAVRLPSMIFALLTGLLIFIWARELYGVRPALLSLLLYVFNPNFIAHGKELTSDVSTSFFVLAWVYCLWKLLKTRAPLYFLLLSLAAGGAMLSKFSSLIILPVSVLLLLPAFYQEVKKAGASVILKWGAAAAAFGLLLLLYINAGYLFQGSFMPASQYAWKSSSYQKKLGTANIPIPFPKVFAEGLDYTKYLEENPHIGRGNNYILGKLHRKGRWYSFAVMVGLKTPLAFFLLLVLAFINKNQEDAESKLFLWVPFAAWFLIFSLCCKAQLGIRYLLPGLTFPLIFAGSALAPSLSKAKINSIILLASWYVLSSVSYFPHALSYFNELIGQRINAYKFIADSNLDWEDKKYFIDQFKSEHPKMKITEDPLKPVSGYIIVGANNLVGVMEEHRFDWLRNNFKPLCEITYSHYLYYVPEDQLAVTIAKKSVSS